MAVASITKTFVAAEVMLLAKAGKVDLDKPISTYVQHKLTANNATVRQHLSMTSGVPDFQDDDYRELDKAVAAAPGRHWTLGQVLSYHTANIGAPGSASGYSNPSYELLGLLIEKVTGKPLAAVLRRDLATPAGLKHAAFQDGEKPQPPAAIDDNESCGEPDGYLPVPRVRERGGSGGWTGRRRTDGRALGIPVVRRSRATGRPGQRDDQGRRGVRAGDDAVPGRARHRSGVRSFR